MLKLKPGGGRRRRTVATLFKDTDTKAVVMPPRGNGRKVAVSEFTRGVKDRYPNILAKLAE